MAKAEKDAEKELTIEERLIAIQERQLALQEAQLANQVRQTKVQEAQNKQTARKSNQFGPLISAYNPRGEKDFPMPQLKFEIEIGFVQTPLLHGMDREEVELVNLLEPCETFIELNDGSMQQVCVVGQQNAITKQWEKIALRGPKDPDTGKYMALFTHSNKQQFPALKKILRGILGDKANGVMTMAEETRRVKQWAEAEDKDAAIEAGALAASIGA